MKPGIYNRFIQAAGTGKTGPMVYVAVVFITIGLFIMGQVPSSTVVKLWGDGTVNFTAEIAKRMSYPVFFSLLMFAFVFGLLGLGFGVRYLHQRPFSSVVSYERKFRRKYFFYGIGITLLIVCATDAVNYFLYPGDFIWQFDPAAFFPFLLAALILFPLQTGFEELFFRGYLMPSISYHSRVPMAGLVVSSILFALMHGANNEISEFGVWKMMAVYGSLGLVLGMITLVSEGVEIAWGVHLANNLYVALVKTFPGSSLQTPALFTTPPPDATALLSESLILCLVLLVLVFFRFRKQNLAKLLT